MHSIIKAAVDLFFENKVESTSTTSRPLPPISQTVSKAPAHITEQAAALSTAAEEAIKNNMETTTLQMQ